MKKPNTRIIKKSIKKINKRKSTGIEKSEKTTFKESKPISINKRDIKDPTRSKVTKKITLRKSTDNRFEKSQNTKLYGNSAKKTVLNTRDSHTGNTDNMVRLNKYIANAGICSRREADKLIASGVVSINGKIITELGTKVSVSDIVQFGGQTLKGEKLRYILLNKPKDFITTVDDPEERKTVMSLIKDACKERVYPVGRLDRNTTGLLLFTNDGELAKKLTHPKHNIKKIYHVELEKKLSSADMIKVKEGLELDDGFVKVDDIEYAENGENKKIVGVVIHSGKNHIVRRIFEHIDYKVKKLDRVVFANLTKLNLPRGRWRFLTEEEINILRRIK